VSTPTVSRYKKSELKRKRTNGWAQSFEGKLRAKGTEILSKRICLSDTLFTTGTSLGSNPELCGERTTSSYKSHATAWHIIFGSIYGELFSHKNVAVLFYKSL